MSTDTVIRDNMGKILGRISRNDSTGNLTLRDDMGKILGYYYKSLDMTKDNYGNLIAHGNCLTMLLKD